MTTRLLVGHVMDRLRELPDGSVHMVWTSPPYYGLRSYGTEPQVWGGDPACSHVWGEMQRNGKRGDLKPADQTTSKGRIGVDERQAQGVLNGGNFCSSCGAWRGEHGLEPSFGLWLDHEVLIFQEVRRVLRDDGLVFLNIGDAYATEPNGRSAADQKDVGTDDRTFRDKPVSTVGPIYQANHRPSGATGRRGRSGNLGNGGISGKDIPEGRIVAAGYFKNKDRLMMPHRLAIALHTDGWWVRDDIVLHKLNPMPSSVKDRTCPAHESLFMLSKAPRYFYDHTAIMEACAVADWDDGSRVFGGVNKAGADAKHARTTGRVAGQRYSFARDGVKYGAVPGQKPQFRADRDDTGERPAMRLKRSVWSQSMEPFSEAHFATAPTGWVRPCILAGTSQRGVCPDCAAPWERITKARTENRGSSGRLGTKIKGKGHPSSQVREGHDVRNGPTSVVTTLGFRPTCRCYDALYRAEFAKARRARKRTQREASGDWWRRVRQRAGRDQWKTRPATVLDPFGGAGTTALVAEELGRLAILIELNPNYAKIARKRLRENLGRVQSDLPEDKPSDLPLFSGAA